MTGLAAHAAIRAAIRAEVAAIAACDRTEQAHRAQALAWIDSGAGLFRVAKPATPPIHLVSYFAVLDGEHILLVDHRNAKLWLPPGGHVDVDEHPRATVARELQEELGFAAAHAIGAPLMVTCSETVGLTAGHTDVSLWYLVHATRSQPLRFDDTEFTAVQWFAVDAAPRERCDPNLARFLRKLAQSREV